MPHRLAVGLALLLSAAAVGVEKPIPQDYARMEQRARERLEWNRRTMQGAYDRVGKKDPRWDKPAREALDLAALMYSQQVNPLIWSADVHPSAKRAIEAGCDDPLILYVYARTSAGPYAPTPEEYRRRLQAAADAMAASDYPPQRRANALRYAAENDTWQNGVSPERRQTAERELDAILDLLPRSIAEDPRGVNWEDGWYDLLLAVIRMRRQLGEEARAAFDRVDARVAKVQGIEPLRLMVKGSFLHSWGWEARGTGFAPQVSDQQADAFESRLREARVAARRAWELNHDQPHAASLMLEIEKGIGGGDRAAMETWFERAMNADGNDEGACWSKLDWLDPKWYGGDSPAEMMAFGRACRETRNWRAGITLLSAEAHHRYQSMLPRKQGEKYLQRPEVWSAVRSVYDEYLGHFLHDNVNQSKYAMICYFGAHYPEAHAQFQAVGEHLTTWPKFPNVPLEGIKWARDVTAQKVAAGPRGGAPSAPPGGAAGVLK
jgi:hypothetical protein